MPRFAVNDTVLTVCVPNIGDFENIDVIEVLVTPGNSIKVETPLITLESDKATMDIPHQWPERFWKFWYRKAGRSVRETRWLKS